MRQSKRRAKTGRFRAPRPDRLLAKWGKHLGLGTKLLVSLSTLLVAFVLLWFFASLTGSLFLAVPILYFVWNTGEEITPGEARYLLTFAVLSAYFLLVKLALGGILAGLMLGALALIWIPAFLQNRGGGLASTLSLEGGFRFHRRGHLARRHLRRRVMRACVVLVLLVVSSLPLADARSDEGLGALASGLGAASAKVAAAFHADVCKGMAGDASLSMSNFQLAAAGCAFTPTPPVMTTPPPPAHLSLPQKAANTLASALGNLGGVASFTSLAATGTFPAQALANALAPATPTAASALVDPRTPSQLATQPNTPAGVAASAAAAAANLGGVVLQVEVHLPGPIVKAGDKIVLLLTSNTLLQTGTVTFTCGSNHAAQTTSLEGGPSLVVTAEIVLDCRGVVAYDVMVPNGHGGKLAEATGSFIIPESNPAVTLSLPEGITNPYPSDAPVILLATVATPDAPLDPASRVASLRYTPSTGQSVTIPVTETTTLVKIADANVLPAGSYVVKFQAVTKSGLVGPSIAWSFDVAAHTSLGFTNHFQTTNVPSGSNAVLLADVDCGAAGYLTGSVWWDVTQFKPTTVSGIPCAKGHNAGLTLGRHAYLAGTYYACVNLQLLDADKNLLADSQGTCGSLDESARLTVLEASGAPPPGGTSSTATGGATGTSSQDTSTTSPEPPGSVSSGADGTAGANSLLNHTQAGATNVLNAAQASATSAWFGLTHGTTLWIVLGILTLSLGSIVAWYARQHGLLERWGISPTVTPPGTPGPLRRVLHRLRHPFGGGQTPSEGRPSLTLNIQPPAQESLDAGDFDDELDDDLGSQGAFRPRRASRGRR